MTTKEHDRHSVITKPAGGGPDSDTRDTLIEAYLKLCTRVGAGNVTIAQIAKESGYSFGTVRYHFAGENANITQSAILHVLEEATRFLQRQIALAKDQPGYDPIEVYVRTNFIWMKELPGHCRFILYYYYLCSTQVSLVAENSVFLKVSRTRIEDFLAEGIGRGLYPRAKDLKQLSISVHNVLIGACIGAMIEGNAHPGSPHEQYAVDQVRAIIHAQGLAS